MISAALTKKDMLDQIRRADPVWLTVAILLVMLALWAPEQALAAAEFAAKSLFGLGPYLALAVLGAGFARASGADELFSRASRGRTAPMIVAAALFGALSPFCSCGVVPLIAALLSMGVPLPAVMAFWLSSPIMDPAMFFLTAGTLGLDFAIAKTLAAVGLGLAGGAVTLALWSRGRLAAPLRDGIAGCGGACERPRAGGKIVWAFWRENARRRVFLREGRNVTFFLAKWLTLAFVLESLMLAYVPADRVAAVLGGHSLWAIPLATVAGVPAYLNGYAALPLVGGLIEMGTVPGAAMAFLVAGGVTSIPAAIAVYALVKKPVFLLYLALSLAGGLASGILFQLWAG